MHCNPFAVDQYLASPIQATYQGSLRANLIGCHKMKVRKRANWHRADVVAALKKWKVSLAEIGRRHGMAPSTVKNSLDKPYPNGERWIAETLELKPEDIWPERYEQHV